MHDAIVKGREQTEAMLVRLRNDLSLLDQTIEAEMKNSPTRDLHHFAIPMTVRALITRRENLKATIALLLLELSEKDPRESTAA